MSVFTLDLYNMTTRALSDPTTYDTSIPNQITDATMKNMTFFKELKNGLLKSALKQIRIEFKKRWSKIDISYLLFRKLYRLWA